MSMMIMILKVSKVKEKFSLEILSDYTFLEKSFIISFILYYLISIIIVTYVSIIIYNNVIVMLLFIILYVFFISSGIITVCLSVIPVILKNKWPDYWLIKCLFKGSTKIRFIWNYIWCYKHSTCNRAYSDNIYHVFMQWFKLLSLCWKWTICINEIKKKLNGSNNYVNNLWNINCIIGNVTLETRVYSCRNFFFFLINYFFFFKEKKISVFFFFFFFLIFCIF